MSRLLSPGEHRKSHPEKRRKWLPAGRQMWPRDTGKRENISPSPNFGTRCAQLYEHRESVATPRGFRTRGPFGLVAPTTLLLSGFSILESGVLEFSVDHLFLLIIGKCLRYSVIYFRLAGQTRAYLYDMRASELNRFD